MSDLTNMQLLSEHQPKALLTAIERQRQFVLRINAAQCACPSCGHPSNIFEAQNVEINDYDFGATQHPAECPSCKRPLKQQVPITGGWHWAIDHEREGDDRNTRGPGHYGPNG